MFQRLFGREKNSQNKDKTEEDSRPRPRRIAWAEVPDVETQDQNNTGTSWLQKLFGRSVNKDKTTDQDSCSYEPPAAPTTTAGDLHPEQDKPKKKKKTVWKKVLNCCKKKNRVAPSPPEDKVSKETETERKQDTKNQTENKDQKDQRTQKDQTDQRGQKDRKDRKDHKDHKDQRAQKDHKDQRDQRDQKDQKDQREDDGAARQALAKQDPHTDSAKTGPIRNLAHFRRHLLEQPRRVFPGVQQIGFGFPNPFQICYMNSSLQSLITLVDFIRDISCQEEVWTVAPVAEVIGMLMNVVRSRRSADPQHKLKALISFKRAVSEEAPEFKDNEQKDAHEFLTTVIYQIRNLSPVLEEAAFIMGREYKCPVQENLVFSMLNTRTCKSCGGQSTREEEFTSLSLTLQPGGSVQDMLQDYLAETDLDFRCDCGANISGQQYNFKTLPKVLILHLKRFCFNSFWQLQKLCSPVKLQRKLQVTSSQDDGCYSLVSIISHLGLHGNHGHYICDGVHPDAGVDHPADRWLTYDDARVTETTGAAVCEERQRSAYVLLYTR